MRTILHFLRDEEGTALAEYALLLGILMLAIVTVINTFRDDIARVFTNAGNAFAP